MIDKILCPTCGGKTGNEAIMDSIYGITCCQQCLDKSRMEQVSFDDSLVVGLSSRDKRIAHWKKIKSRVTTHEGEMLTGQRGESYINKYGKQYLGVEPRTNFDAPQYQRELDKKR